MRGVVILVSLNMQGEVPVKTQDPVNGCLPRWPVFDRIILQAELQKSGEVFGGCVSVGSQFFRTPNCNWTWSEHLSLTPNFASHAVLRILLINYRKVFLSNHSKCIQSFFLQVIQFHPLKIHSLQDKLWIMTTLINKKYTTSTKHMKIWLDAMVQPVHGSDFNCIPLWGL